MLPLYLTLLLLPASPGGTAPDASLASTPLVSLSSDAARPTLSMPRHAATLARPTALGARLREIRSRFAPAPPPVRASAPARTPEREIRAPVARPLPSTTLGALERRLLLGDRTYASAQDPRLGAQERRLVLSRAPPARPRGR